MLAFEFYATIKERKEAGVTGFLLRRSRTRSFRIAKG
jgi:hypothetical protein